MPPRSPLPKVCIALGFADPSQLLAHALAEYESGERFLEFRLDYLPHPEDGLNVIKIIEAAYKSNEMKNVIEL